MTDTRLTNADKRTIASARELAALDGPGIRVHLSEDDVNVANARAIGKAQWLLGELASLAERLAGEDDTDDA